MSDERDDHHVRLAHGNVRITHNARAGVWFVSWYPDEGVEGDPGYTYSSASGECPDGPGLQEMVTWVMAQPWASRSGELAAGSTTEDIAAIAGQLADVTRTVEEVAKRLAALGKPSGSASQQERTKTQQVRNDHGARELAEASERLQAAVDALRVSIWQPAREHADEHQEGLVDSHRIGVAITTDEDIAAVAGQLAEVTHRVEEMAAQLKILRDRADTQEQLAGLQQERVEIQQERIDLAARELAEVSARIQAAADALRASL